MSSIDGSAATPSTVVLADVGVVVIGRNEGERLKRCINSVQSLAAHVVYVDSGSTDGSAEWARSQGAEVIDLDVTRPFTAARARNAGFQRLRELAPGLPFVQFVDGDCEVVSGWLVAAHSFLHTRMQAAVACGRRRERKPEASIYNRLCDAEWNTPVGKARSCGGDAMMRADAFVAAEGYRDDLIAGEEPELCVRLRAKGWEIWRIAPDMTLHDADITRFGQWWKRAQRGGHAFAEGAFLHGAPPERHGVVQAERALVWGVALPLLMASMALFNPLWLLLVLVYPVQMLRLAIRYGIREPAERARAIFYVLGRFPEAQGVVQFWVNRLRRRRAALIEYK